MQLIFDVKVSLSPLIIIDKAPILLNLHSHIEDPAEAKYGHKECEKPVESRQDKIEPVIAIQSVQMLAARPYCVALNDTCEAVDTED